MTHPDEVMMVNDRRQVAEHAALVASGKMVPERECIHDDSTGEWTQFDFMGGAPLPGAHRPLINISSHSNLLMWVPSHSPARPQPPSAT